MPVDLHNEHLNRKLKDVVSGVGANMTEGLIVEPSKSLNSVDTTTVSVHHTEKFSTRPEDNCETGL